jgi:hypothetical protein
MQQQQQQQQQQGERQRQPVPVQLPPGQQPCKQDRRQQQQQQTAPLQPGHTVAFKTSVGFVDHIWELLAPLLSGADMLLLPDAVAAPAAAGLHGSADDRWLAPQQQQQGIGLDRMQASLMLQPEVLVQLLVEHRVTHLVSCLLRWLTT